jgi:N-methylhydantoinase B
MMPADQETIRIWGVHGWNAQGRFFLFREVLGGGSGGRWYADGSDVIHIVPNSRNLPAEFSETQYPLIVEELALRTDSGGPGKYRGGLGYDKKIRVLQDVHLLSNADRSILPTYGVKGGRAGLPYRLTLDPDGANPQPVDGLADDVPVRANQVIRIETTGGGGWGDPLEREPEAVRADVARGLVSARQALEAYGVVLRAGTLAVDVKATAGQRRSIRKTRAPLELFDRGSPATS